RRSGDGHDGARSAARRPARGHRARVLCRAHADGDRRASQTAPRYREDADQAGSGAAPRGGEGELMNHEPYDTLAATYAVGALDGQERVDFERHLAAGCDVCEATLRESAEALATLARSRPPVIPPPTVKDELMRRIAATTPARRGGSRPRPLVWAVGTVV